MYWSTGPHYTTKDDLVYLHQRGEINGNLSHYLNLFAQSYNGWKFPKSVSKSVFSHKEFWLSGEFVLKSVRGAPIGKESTLVQVVVWRWTDALVNKNQGVWHTWVAKGFSVLRLLVWPYYMKSYVMTWKRFRVTGPLWGLWYNGARLCVDSAFVGL